MFIVFVIHFTILLKVFDLCMIIYPELDRHYDCECGHDRGHAYDGGDVCDFDSASFHLGPSSLMAAYGEPVVGGIQVSLI